MWGLLDSMQGSPQPGCPGQRQDGGGGWGADTGHGLAFAPCEL